MHHGNAWGSQTLSTGQRKNSLRAGLRVSCTKITDNLNFVIEAAFEDRPH